MAKQRSQAADNTVLYLAETDQLLPYDDQRKGRSSPLPWVKFRTPGDATPTGQAYQLRRQAIKAMPHGFAILGVYDELLATYGGDRAAPLRGFIVGHRWCTASPAQVAKAIGCDDVALVRRAIRALLGEDLLLQAPRPDFAEAIQRDKTIEYNPKGPHSLRHSAGRDGAPPTLPHDANEPNDSHRHDGPHGQERPAEGEAKGTRNEGPHGPERTSDVGSPTGRAANAAARGQPPAGPPGRNVSGKFPDAGGGTRDTRSETSDGQTADAVALPSSASAAPSPLSAPGNGNTGNEETAPAPAAPSPSPDEPTGHGQTADGGTGVDADAQTPDAGGQPPRTGCPTADGRSSPTATPTRREPEPLLPTEADRPGSTAWERPQGYQDRLDVLVRSIGKALYPTREDLVANGRLCRPMQAPDEFEAREAGCLRVAWLAVLSLGLSDVELLKLQMRGEKEAASVRRKRTVKPKGAVWRHWLNKHMEASHSGTWATACREARRQLGSGPP